MHYPLPSNLTFPAYSGDNVPVVEARGKAKEMTPEDKTLIEEFIESLSLVGSSPRCYRDNLKTFANRMEPYGGLPCASCDDVLGWLDGNAPRTYNCRLSVLRSFYTWLSIETASPLSPIAVMRDVRPLAKWERAPLSADDVRKALSAVCDPRDALVCRLALLCGLGPAEITGIAICDVEAAPPVRILCGPLGKYGRRRIIEPDPVTASMAVSQARLRLSQGADPSGPLVASRSNNSLGKPLTGHSANNIVNSALSAIGTTLRNVSRP